MEAGFIWADLLTNLERSADHCSNIAVCLIDAHAQNMNLHESARELRAGNSEFDAQYRQYAAKYLHV